MKLVDKDGHFQFIKNGQVDIDQTLPKYERISEAQKLRNDLRNQVQERGVAVVEEGNGTQHMILPEQRVDPDSQSIQSYINVFNDDVYADADKVTRETISGLKIEELHKYLLSEDAQEFNKKFKPILDAERRDNGYSINVTTNRWIYENEAIGTYVAEGEKGKLSVFKKAVEAVKKVFKEEAKEEEEQKDAALHVIDFFNIIHVESGKEKEFIDKLSGYFTLIRNAALMHQDAQLDELCQNIILHIYESVLSVHGMNKYIEFSEIEKMKCNGKRVVDIDYIKNFGRVIPDNIVEKKLFADKLGVFDNYCVMYYDPSGETYKAPEAAKRDPILFGLINHSHKLYYIADWVDELCDLTLEKVAERCQIKDVDTDKVITETTEKEKKKTSKKAKKTSKKK